MRATMINIKDKHSNVWPNSNKKTLDPKMIWIEYKRNYDNIQAFKYTKPSVESTNFAFVSIQERKHTCIFIGINYKKNICC